MEDCHCKGRDSPPAGLCTWFHPSDHSTVLTVQSGQIFLTPYASFSASIYHPDLLRKDFKCPVTLDNLEKFPGALKWRLTWVLRFLEAFGSTATQNWAKLDILSSLPHCFGDENWLWHNAINSDPPDGSPWSLVIFSASLFSICQNQALLGRTGILGKLSNEI